MNIEPIKTALIKPGGNIFSIFSKKIKKLNEGDIIAISSKIVAVRQKRIIKKSPAGIRLTLKEGILIPNEGMDFSNVEKGYAVLWPENPQKEAEIFREKARKKYGVKKLGIIIIDSHCSPLRRGTTALVLGCAGFEPVKDERNKKDLFGKKLEVTQIAIADSLACAAHSVMGEAAERTPFVIIKNAKVKFTNRKIRSAELKISPKKCLFKELYPKSML